MMIRQLMLKLSAVERYSEQGAPTVIGIGQYVLREI